MFFRPIPDGDILIHAGDFTRCGHLQEVRDFNTWLGTLPHKHKIVIAGNHELSFDQIFRDKIAAAAEKPNDQAPFSPRMVYGGNDARSAFSVSRSVLDSNPNVGSNLKIPELRTSRTLSSFPKTEHGSQ